MAAGFTLKKNKIKLLDQFIQNDYLKKVPKKVNLNKYDMELSSSAIKKEFMNDINKLGPFGNLNLIPIFLIKNLRIIKFNIINNKHVSVIIKTYSGSSFKGICFNCINTKIGEYLISYKKNINIIGQISENIWNNKKTIQLNIKDLIL